MTPAAIAFKFELLDAVERSPKMQLFTTARNEVEALGWITTETAAKLRAYGIDPAQLERRLLDA